MKKLRSNAKKFDVELARWMYWSEGMTLREVGDHFMVSADTIFRRFRREGIPTRSRKDILIASWKSWSQAHPDKPKHPRKRINGENVAMHKVIAERVLGRPLKKNECVHHIDANRHNNNNDNLLICTRSYHTWLHRKMAKIAKENDHER